jgi:hypothetical protein
VDRRIAPLLPGNGSEATIHNVMKRTSAGNNRAFMAFLRSLGSSNFAHLAGSTEVPRMTCPGRTTSAQPQPARHNWQDTGAATLHHRTQLDTMNSLIITDIARLMDPARSAQQACGNHARPGGGSLGSQPSRRTAKVRRMAKTEGMAVALILRLLVFGVVDQRAAVASGIPCETSRSHESTLSTILPQTAKRRKAEPAT